MMEVRQGTMLEVRCHKNTGLLRFLLCLMICVLCLTGQSWASNLQLSNLDEVSANTAAGTITFSFNLTQDNSWYGTYNYDAVWIFMKYSTNGGATWQHAHMAGTGINPAGF